MKKSLMEDYDYLNQIITVNGVKMTMKAYNAQKSAATRAKRIKDRNAKLIPILPQVIAQVMKELTATKSLGAYESHAYRQWGRIIDIINEYIGSEIRLFNIKYRAILRQIKKIESIAKENDKDVFQYIEKLFFLVDDLNTLLLNLVSKTSNVRLFQNPALVGKECIEGSPDGKRLGLRQLISRSSKEFSAIENIKRQLMFIVDNGVDIMEYTSRGRRIT